MTATFQTEAGGRAPETGKDFFVFSTVPEPFSNVSTKEVPCHLRLTFARNLMITFFVAYDLETVAILQASSC